jgi:hypothetical protein
MLSSNFPVWVSKSIVKHFTDALDTSHNVIVEGERKSTETTVEHIELRIDGPKLNEISNNLWHSRVEVDFLVLADSGVNLYRPHQICGEIQRVCTDIILYKIDDTGNIIKKLGCLTLIPQIRDNIAITHYGQFKPDVPITQSTVVVHYEIRIKENVDNASD